MDSLEVNKTIAAVLVAGIAFMVTGFIGEILVHPRELEKPVIQIAGVPAETAPGGGQPETNKAPPILGLLASADTAKGQQVAQQDCAICHTFGKGEPAKIGPNLYGVVGGPRAHMAGFDYTEGLKKLGGDWTYENLNQWLFDPHSVVPTTRMAFAGIKNNKDRADVIAWLRTLSPNPPPPPSPEEVKAEQAQTEKPAAPAAPAEQKGAPAPEQKAGQPAAPQPDFGALVAKADPAKGKADAETQCAICHTFGKGEPAKIGPNLYGVVGAPRAHMAGFDYTEGLKKLGGTWTYDDLNQWLTNPMAVVPNTRMIFPGVKSEKERADIVAYLRTLSDHPEPLPEAAPAGGQAGAPAQPTGAQPGQTQVNPAREGTSGEQAAPAAGGTSQETPAEKASPGGAGVPQSEPQAGAPGAPTPEHQKP